ncbi:MAG: type II secretion system F family protein [Gemmataceae bacterium]|nr:type II secretion system F family protein [Gemmataceae bacterium]
MSGPLKVLLVEVWFVLFLPMLGVALVFALGLLPGLIVFLLLFLWWCWQLFAYVQYRFCRQEEFLHVLQTAAATQAPLESVLRAYLEDRPQGGLYRFWVGSLLFFVFPGFYWVHLQRRFDARLAGLLQLLEAGVPLHRALGEVPGVVSREIALAITVGQFTGRLPEALHHLPRRHSASAWVELLPRLLYPLLLLVIMLLSMTFLTIFIIPKFEKIFTEFKLKLPGPTQSFIGASRWFARYSGEVFLLGLNLLILINLLLFSSRAKWYCPGVGRLYRLQTRGQFLQTLGLALQTGKPVPEVLDSLLEARLFPRVVEKRVELLQADLEQGQPLVPSLARHGLITESLRGLLVAAEKAHNLPWALEELGDTLSQRAIRGIHRLTMVLFPLTIFACACLVALVALSLFSPLVAMIEGMHG